MGASSGSKLLILQKLLLAVDTITISFGSSSRGVYCVVSVKCNVMVLDVPSGLTVNVQFFLPRLSLYNWLLRNVLLVRFVTEFMASANPFRRRIFVESSPPMLEINCKKVEDRNDWVNYLLKKLEETKKKYTAKELQLIEVTTFKAATTGQYDEDQIITSIMNMILKPNEEWSAKKKKPKYTYQDHFMIKLTKKKYFLARHEYRFLLS